MSAINPQLLHQRLRLLMKWVLISLLLSISLFVGIPEPVTYVILILQALVSAVLVFRLAQAWASRAAWLWAIVSLPPSIPGLIVLLIVSRKAARILKSHGITVGFLG